MKNLTSKQIYGILNDVCTNVIEPNLAKHNGFDLEYIKKGLQTPYFQGSFDNFNDTPLASLTFWSDKVLASLIENQVRMILCSDAKYILLWTGNGQKIQLNIDGIWIMLDNIKKANDQNNTTKHVPKTVLVNGQILAKVSFNSDTDKAKLQKHIDSGKIRFIPNGVKATKQDKARIMAHANLLVFCQNYLRSEALRVSWKLFYEGVDLLGSIEKGKIESKRIKESRLAAKEERRIIELIPSLKSYKTIPTYRMIGNDNFIVSKLREYKETKIINFSGREYLSYLEPLIYELALVA